MLNVQSPVDSMGFRVDFLPSLWNGVIEQFKERLVGKVLNVQSPVDSMGIRVDFLPSLWNGVIEQFKEQLAGLKRGYLSEGAKTSSLLLPKELRFEFSYFPRVAQNYD